MLLLRNCLGCSHRSLKKEGWDFKVLRSFRLPTKSPYMLQYPHLPAGGVSSHSVKQPSSVWRLLVERRWVDANVESDVSRQTDRQTDSYSCSVVLDNIHVSEVYIKRATCKKKMHWLFVRSSMIKIIPLYRELGFFHRLLLLGIVVDDGLEFRFFFLFVLLCFYPPSSRGS